MLTEKMQCSVSGDWLHGSDFITVLTNSGISNSGKAQFFISTTSAELGIGTYCKSGNFRENFIFAYSVKIHICDSKKSGLGHDLPISVNDRVISAFGEDFIFTKPKPLEKKFRIYSTTGICSRFVHVYAKGFRSLY